MKTKEPPVADYLGVHERLYQALKRDCHNGWGGDQHDRRVKATLEIVLRAFKKIPLSPPANLLDLGCGDGSLAILLGALGFTVCGVDISPTAVQWAKEKARKSQISVTFSVQNVVELKFPEEHFDGIIDSACAHCIIGPSRDPYFQGIFRALKLYGSYVLMCLCEDPVEEEILNHFDNNTRTVVKNGIAGRYYGHLESILNEVSLAGLTIQSFMKTQDSETNQTELFLVAVKTPREK